MYLKRYIARLLPLPIFLHATGGVEHSLLHLKYCA